jgi:hypothetical protein
MIVQDDQPTTSQRVGAWCLVVLLAAGVVAFLIGAFLIGAIIEATS